MYNTPAIQTRHILETRIMTIDQTTIMSILPNAQCKGAPLELMGEWSVDSRTINKGDIFVAIAGARVDGHDFVGAALAAGAQACMVAEQRWPALRELFIPYQDSCMMIIVPDPLSALLAIARQWRMQFTYPVVGITGSVGKTTTKEVVGAILQEAGVPHLVSRGNQNTLIGAALNMLRMRPEHATAVFEMGISRRGEMATLAQLVQPTISVITNIGHTHLEGLGAIGDIAAEKRHIFDGMQPDHTGIILGDQSCLAVAYHIPIVRFGTKMHNQVQARQIRFLPNGIEFALKIYQNRYIVRLATPHLARVYNVLAAATIAHCLNIPHEAILRGVHRPLVIPGRFAQYTVAQHTVIDDSYNACPESMKEALAAFEHLYTPGRKVVVLGDMSELGVNTLFWHRQLGRMLRKINSLHHVILVGEHCKESVLLTLPRDLTHETQENWQAAAESLKRLAEKSTLCILVKGSRRVALDKLVATFRGQD